MRKSRRSQRGGSNTNGNSKPNSSIDPYEAAYGNAADGNLIRGGVNAAVTNYFNYYKNSLTNVETSEAKSILGIFKPGDIDRAISKIIEVYPEYKDLKHPELLDEIIHQIKTARSIGETVRSLDEYTEILDAVILGKRVLAEEAARKERRAATEEEEGNSRIPQFLAGRTHNPYSSGPPRKGWNEQYGQ